MTVSIVQSQGVSSLVLYFVFKKVINAFPSNPSLIPPPLPAFLHLCHSHLSNFSINSNSSIQVFSLSGYPSGAICPPVLVWTGCFPGWLYQWYMEPYFDHLGKSFCGSFVLVSLPAGHIFLLLFIYFSRKGCMSYTIFSVFCLIFQFNFCDSLAGYKFLVWKWFSFRILKWILFCHPTSGLRIEMSETNLIPSSLYVTFFPLWKPWDILSILQV